MKLAIALDAAGIDLALLARGITGWRIEKEVRLPWRVAPTAQESFAERLVGTIRPTLLAWGVKPQTEALIVPPAEIGGIASATFEGKLDDEQLRTKIEQTLAARQPFPLRELEYDSRVVVAGKNASLLSIFWLPRGWVIECKAAFARLGVLIAEFYGRAPLLAGSRESSHAAWLLLEQAGNTVSAYAFRAGVPELMFSTPADPAALGLSIQAMLGSYEARPIVGSGLDPALAQSCARFQEGRALVQITQASAGYLILRHWLSGGAGIWVKPDPQLVLARYTPALIAVVVLALVGVVGASWYERSLSAEVKQLGSTQAKLAPTFRKVEAKQREVFALQAQLDRFDRFGKLASPLETLTLLSEKMPEKSWLVRYHYRPESIVLEGYGSTASDVGKLFGKTKLVMTPAQAQVAQDPKLKPFALTLNEQQVKPRPAKANPKSTGKPTEKPALKS
ncbi:hypothetical protein [Parachitinimonas caeni]|uniref:General secretion pathway protein L n=1 Tax=Parachitinimonas caeni TaxID=3031301 RepID=A0ABT7DS17_9NEIS|nr:hypothetical protein [Parachitinimonas caeni]MDK2122865.1 hypothetical protein [Parachitinimonas caeni]